MKNIYEFECIIKARIETKTEEQAKEHIENGFYDDYDMVKVNRCVSVQYKCDCGNIIKEESNQLIGVCEECV